MREHPMYLFGIMRYARLESCHFINFIHWEHDYLCLSGMHGTIDKWPWPPLLEGVSPWAN